MGMLAALVLATFTGVSANAADTKPKAKAACAACAEACKTCGAECDKFDSPEMKACAKACRECERTCREMVKAMGGREHR
jgi:hypothetical protein